MYQGWLQEGPNPGGIGGWRPYWDRIISYYEGIRGVGVGGLKCTFEVAKTKAIPPFEKITLVPRLPEGVVDNVSWKWSTGEQTKDITVTYTADSGAVSTQSFSIAVAGDCTPDFIRPEIIEDGTIYATTEKTVEYGKGVILYAGNSSGWTDDYKWSNGMKSNLNVIPNIAEERTYKVNCTNLGGNTAQTCFHIKIQKEEK